MIMIATVTNKAIPTTAKATPMPIYSAESVSTNYTGIL